MGAARTYLSSLWLEIILSGLGHFTFTNQSVPIYISSVLFENGTERVYSVDFWLFYGIVQIFSGKFSPIVARKMDF